MQSSGDLQGRFLAMFSLSSPSNCFRSFPSAEIQCTLEQSDPHLNHIGKAWKSRSSPRHVQDAEDGPDSERGVNMSKNGDEEILVRPRWTEDVSILCRAPIIYYGFRILARRFWGI